MSCTGQFDFNYSVIPSLQLDLLRLMCTMLRWLALRQHRWESLLSLLVFPFRPCSQVRSVFESVNLLFDLRLQRGHPPIDIPCTVCQLIRVALQQHKRKDTENRTSPAGSFQIPAARLRCAATPGMPTSLLSRWHLGSMSLLSQQMLC